MKEATVTKVGMWASIACIIHCTLLPILVPFLPLLSHVEYEAEWLDAVFWVLSTTTAVWQIWQYPGLIRGWFILCVIVGTVSILMHLHELLHVAFYGVGVGSLEALRRNRREWREWREDQAKN